MKCNLCGNKENFFDIWHKGRFNRRVENYLCRNCGLIFVGNQIDKKYYETKYREDYSNSKIPNYNAAMRLAERRYDFIKDLDFNTVLDIGCGYGHFLHLMHKKEKACWGFEPDKKAEEYVSDKFNIVVIDAYFKPLKKVKYDMITMFHVLEHMSDPMKTLIDIKKSLRGYLYIEVPNLKKPVGNLNNYFQDVHLYSFTPTTLNACMSKLGFELVKMRVNENISAVYKIGSKKKPIYDSWINTYLDLLEYQIYYKQKGWIFYNSKRVLYKLWSKLKM